MTPSTLLDMNCVKIFIYHPKDREERNAAAACHHRTPE